MRQKNSALFSNYRLLLKKMEAFFDARPDAQVHMGGAGNVFLNILNDNSFSFVDCSKKNASEVQKQKAWMEGMTIHASKASSRSC